MMRLLVCWGLVAVLLTQGDPAVAATRLVPHEYPTIQAAVEAAAAGDEIVVSAGEYGEQVVITKDLVVTGAGIGQTVLIAPEFMPHEAHTLRYNAVIHVELPATSVVLRDFTVDGAGRGRLDTRFTGIMFDRAGGVAERLDLRNVHPTPVSSLATGICLYAYSQPSDNLDLLVQDVTMQTFQKSGFACFGSGCRLDLRNVVADASLLYTDSVQNGFELLNASSGSLANCTARGFWYDGSPIANTTAVGFLFYYGASWTVDNCLADENQSGIYGIGTNLVMRSVEVVGSPRPLAFNYGIVATGPWGGKADKAGLAEPRALSGDYKLLVSEYGIIVALDNCRVRGTKQEGSIGMVAFSSLEEVSLDLANSEFESWEVGLHTVESGGGWVVGRARTCRLQEHTLEALRAETFLAFDARGNYWGDPSGPFHPLLNPNGSGGGVGGNVIVDPWLYGNVACSPVPLYIAQADADGIGYAREVAVRYLGGADRPVYGFSTELTWDQTKLTATISDVSRPDSGPFQTASLFQVLPLSSGLRVDGALGGARPGIESGELFTVRFHLVGEPDGVPVPIVLNVRHLRNSANLTVTGYTANDGLVIGDVKAPNVSTLKVINTSLDHTDDFAKQGDLLQVNATITDGDPLFGHTSVVGNFIHLFGGHGYLRYPDSLVNDQFTWLKQPASLFPFDGPVPFSVTAADPAGNVATVAATVTADNTPPQMVSGFTAVAGHNQIDLQWDDPTGLDANLRQIVVRARPTTDYPFYAQPAPAYPAAPAEGDPVYTGLGSAATAGYPGDGSGRAIVSFQAFAIDVVGLVSPTGGGTRDRVPNYLLADVTAGAAVGYDAVTDIYDVTRLGDTFGLAAGEAGFNAECDVGPTDDLTSAGIPLPDSAIDLEDLMVFADRFEFGSPAIARSVSVPDPASPEFVWLRPAPEVWVLALAAPCPEFKGMRLTGRLPGGVVVGVTAGELLRQQPGPHFLWSGGPELDVHLALLGRGVGLDGAGALLRIETSLPLAELEVELEVRSVANTILRTQLSAPPTPVVLPARFALHGNHPNPFNPATTIGFDLPSRQTVELLIYALDGRRVARQRLGILPAGVHQAIWRGCDDDDRPVAAGLYLYRLEAGPWSATGKMNLVK